MKVDFYQLQGTSAEQVIASLAGEILSAGGRLIVVAEDEAFLARLDRMLWDEAPASFIPHGLAGGANDSRQPVLLGTSPDAPNLARNMLIADGLWRESALSYDRSFFLFSNTTLEGARAAWKALGGREGIERRYLAQQSGEWVRKS